MTKCIKTGIFAQGFDLFTLLACEDKNLDAKTAVTAEPWNNNVDCFTNRVGDTRTVHGIRENGPFRSVLFTVGMEVLVYEEETGDLVPAVIKGFLAPPSNGDSLIVNLVRVGWRINDPWERIVSLSMIRTKSISRKELERLAYSLAG